MKWDPGSVALLLGQRLGLVWGPDLLGPESDHESALASVKATAYQWVR
jgi:hypothetical protein